MRYMTLISVLVAVLAFVGTASASQQMVEHQKLGSVTASTAQLYDKMRASKRDAELAKYRSESEQPVVAVEKQGEVKRIVEEKPCPPPAESVKVSPQPIAPSAQVAESRPAEKPQAAPAVESQVASESQRIWGSFPEASLWAGAWVNPKHDTWGFWTDLKYIQWFTKFEEAENFGLGLGLRTDYGEGRGESKWGYVAPGVRAGYYRGLGLKNSFEADGGLFYRIDRNRQDGLMPTVHAEFSRVLDYQNRLIFQVDGTYFPHDSWLGPGVYLEHKLSKNWKVTAGAGASLGWLDGDFFSGFAPSLKFKYKNRYTLGVTSNLFTGQGTFFGLVAAYELTPTINDWYQSKKEKSIKQVSQSKSEKFDGVKISNKTIDEMDK